MSKSLISVSQNAFIIISLKKDLQSDCSSLGISTITENVLSINHSVKLSLSMSLSSFLSLSLSLSSVLINFSKTSFNLCLSIGNMNISLLKTLSPFSFFIHSNVVCIKLIEFKTILSSTLSRLSKTIIRFLLSFSSSSKYFFAISVKNS